MRITSEHNGGGISLEERMRGGGDGDGSCASISGYRPRSRQQRLWVFTETAEKMSLGCVNPVFRYFGCGVEFMELCHCLFLDDAVSSKRVVIMVNVQR